MSTFVTNLSFNVGGELKEEKSYFKFKFGKGQQEGEALRQLIQDGTGKSLSEFGTPLFLRFGNADKFENEVASKKILFNWSDTVGFQYLEPSLEIDNFSDFESKMEGHAPSNGQKWFTFDLEKSTEIKEILEGSGFKELTKMLEEYKDNALFEYSFRSAGDLQGVTREKECPPNPNAARNWEPKLPECKTMFKNFSTNFCADIDSKFVKNIWEFGDKMGMMPPLPLVDQVPSLFEKFEGLELRLNVADAVELSKDSESMASHLSGIWGLVFVASHVGCPPALFEDMRMVFFLNQDTYIDIQMCVPGWGEFSKKSEQDGVSSPGEPNKDYPCKISFK